MTTMVPTRLGRLLAAGILLVAVACGDDDKATPASTIGPTDSATVSTATGDTEPSSLCPDGELVSAGAFDEMTGELLWRGCSAEEVWRTIIGVSDAAMYIKQQGNDGSWTIVAVSNADGSELWRYPGSGHHWGWPQGPVAGSGIVVVTTGTNESPEVVGLDSATGEERWRVNDSGAAIANTDDSVVLTEVRFVPGLSSVTGLDRLTGESRWSLPLAVADVSGAGVGRAPSAVDGDLVVLPTGVSVTGLDAFTGTVLWEGQGIDHPSAAELAVVGYKGATVYVLDAATGETRWEQPGAPAYGDLWAIGGGLLYLQDVDGDVSALDLATGESAWSSNGLGEPVSATAQSVVLLWERWLTVLEPADGTTRWTLDGELGDYMNSAVVSNGLVLVAVNSLPWGD